MAKAAEVAAYRTEIRPDWCPGCGDFGVLNALQRAVSNLGLKNRDVLIVSGIGCSSNLPHYFKSYGFHGIHGRTIPVATGAKLANHGLHVIVTGGDGDGYGIGLGHFVHSMRRNLDITYVVMDNQTYGLTTGQTSPTSEKGMKTKSNPTGVIEMPINPIALALAAGATYVSRGFSGDPSQLSDLMGRAIAHKGFALVDVFSPCVTFNKQNTYDFFRERVYKLEDEDHNPRSLEAAIRKAYEWGPKIPLGVFYETERPTYEDEEPVLRAGPLVKQTFRDLHALERVLEEFL